MEAPSLEQLYLEDFPEMQLLESNRPLPCLHSATVEFGRSEISNEGLTRVLAQISNAKEMRLSWSLLCLLSNDNGDVQLPIFPSLTRLKIGSPGSSCILHSVLNSVPKLQSLNVILEDGRGTMEWEDFNDHGCTPECLLSSLEEIKIEDLIADKGEMEMVACLLEAGVSLKKAHVHIVYDDADVYEEYGDYLKAIHNRLGSLVKLLRSSRGCEAHLFLPFGDEIHVCSDDETHGNDAVDGMEDGDTNVDDGRTDNDNDNIICDGNDGEKQI
ncbi:unnamed protein product [Linum tenue]|uniref:FBD domain-containing protein n=1 Tax=Linum tenue TaxID=586396 RepID=A0AAV0P8S9_9ROSI|nr:unnamed protein product [Linum tenue]